MRKWPPRDGRLQDHGNVEMAMPFVRRFESGRITSQATAICRCSGGVRPISRICRENSFVASVKLVALRQQALC